MMIIAYKFFNVVLIFFYKNDILYMHFKTSLESARWFSKMVVGRKLISTIPSLISERRNTNVHSLTH